jgi:hypothetical protein
MRIDWNWGLFFEDAPFGGKYYHWLLNGTLTTVEVFVCAWLLLWQPAASSAFSAPCRAGPGGFWGRFMWIFSAISRS